MPIGAPRRIFVRKERRIGWRTMGSVFAAGLAVALAGRPVVAGVTGILSDVQPARHLTADNVAVVDGQTLRVAGQTIRLDGVAAPAHGQSCTDGTECAGTAALHLADLVRDRRVACQVDGADTAGHAVARCEAGGENINVALVASGWAEARGGGAALREAENTARAQHLGLWAER